MRQKKFISAVAGFILLFLLYHSTEYMIVFKQNAMGFLAFHALFILAAYAIGRWQFGQGLEAWGFQITPKTLPQLGLGLAAGILLYGITFIVTTALGLEQVISIPSPSQIMSMLGLYIFGNFFASFSEDILTRTYVYKHLHGALNRFPLILLSASIYVLNHVYRLGERPGTHTYLFLLGILFMIPLVKTKQIWLTGGIHWGGNCAFYLTHEIFETKMAQSEVSPNMLLSVFILIWIVIMVYGILPKLSP